MTTRGIKNNNPTNIEKGDAWQGLADDQSGDDRFAVFKAPEYGIRAAVRTLRSYQVRHGLKTVRQMISRWAPPGGSDGNHTDHYIDVVATAMGISPDMEFDVMEAAYARPMVAAMILVENGKQPYSMDVINAALRMAEVQNVGPVSPHPGHPPATARVRALLTEALGLLE